MSILFLTRLFYPHIGGVETHVLKLSRALLKKQHSITILTSQHNKNLPFKQTHQDLNIVRIPNDYLTSKIKLWRWILAHKELFLKAQIVHVHDVFWWYLPLKIIYPHKSIYTTFHGWEGVFPPTLKAILWKQLAFWLSKSSLTVGHYINTWYRIRCPNIVYGATDQKKILSKPNSPNILVYGRLDSDNDMEIVLKALKLVKQKEHSTKITFLGDGRYSPQARRLGRVVGFSPQTSTFLNHSTVTITSSYLSMLDSFAAGRYVFSVYSNQLKKDYLTQHPMSSHFSISSNPQTLADRLLKVFNNPLQTKQDVITAQNWAFQQTWLNLAETYIKLWNNS